MYEELLNIINTYTINKKVPDDNFIDSIISIIIKEEKLIEYVKDIDYNYQNIALASYFYESRILKFNINKMIKDYSDIYKIHKRIYDTSSDYFDKYLFICLSVLEVIFHEIEHVIQNKKANTLPQDSFERKLIEINNIAIEVYPSVYKKHHDLFSIEREANIISCNKIRTFLDMSEITTRYIINVFNSKYNRLIKEYYSKNSCPLLELLTITGGKISYNGIPITRNNTNKILMKTNIFVNPSHFSEGLPTTILEAGMMKCAVVATPMGGTTEIITDDSIGYICGFETSEIQEKIEKIINDKEKMKKLGTNIKEKVEKDFSWNTTAKKIATTIKYSK